MRTKIGINRSAIIWSSSRAWFVLQRNVSQQFATAIYQSELTFQLLNLGYEIEAGKSGAPDVKGYTAEYLEASSPRRQQIEEAIARSGFSGPEAAQIAAHNTRDRKEIHTPSEVLAAHRQIAVEFGNQAERVVAEAKERAATLMQTKERFCTFLAGKRGVEGNAGLRKEYALEPPKARSSLGIC
jgi:hypothetical protein